MVFDGKAHYATTKRMLDKNDISISTWKTYRKRYPNLTSENLISLIKQRTT